MIYIIDGHNLIPHIPGLSLSDLDDEPRLIELVREFCRLSRSQAELFFDGAPPAARPTGGGGQVHAHYVRKGIAADEAIIRFMHQPGRNAKAYSLVSSDHHIQAEARSLGIPILESAAFAQKMLQVLSTAQSSAAKSEPVLSPDDVEAWLREFSGSQHKDS